MVMVTGQFLQCTYLPCLYNSACTVPRICGMCVTCEEHTKNYLALLVVLRLGRPIVVRKAAYVRLLSGTQIFSLQLQTRET